MGINAQFQQFAGKEVLIREEPYKIEFKSSGKAIEGFKTILDEEDPVIKQIKAEASRIGQKIRIMLPDSFGTMDWVPSRLTININKHEDGKYRIDPEFKLG